MARSEVLAGFRGKWVRLEERGEDALYRFVLWDRPGTKLK
jgi:hypothetical protein